MKYYFRYLFVVYCFFAAVLCIYFFVMCINSGHNSLAFCLIGITMAIVAFGIYELVDVVVAHIKYLRKIVAREKAKF